MYQAINVINKIRSLKSPLFATPDSVDSLMAGFSKKELAIANLVAGQISNLALEKAAEIVESSQKDDEGGLPDEGTLTPYMVECAEKKFNATVIGFDGKRLLLKRLTPTFSDKPYMYTTIHCMEHPEGVNPLKQLYPYTVAFCWSGYDLSKPEFPAKDGGKHAY